MDKTKAGGFGLLKGVRVLESALLLNGDSVGMLLADLGAEVIKIEDPVRGDYVRDILGQIKPRVSPAHLQVNKNKRSVAIDLRDPRGRDVFFKLVATADIFVDGLRAGACDAMGIGYEAQAAIKPDLIYIQCTGYGAQGPYANIPTHGYQMTALPGGLPARVNAAGKVERARGVQYMGGVEDSSAASILGAQASVMAGVAALFRRERTGEGAYVDVGASDAVLAAAWQGVVYNLNYERINDFKSLQPKQESYEAKWPEGSARYQLYRTADGKFLLFGGLERKFWDKFCRAVEREDLMDTMRSDILIDYGEDKPWLRDAVQEIIGGESLSHWMELAARLGIPMGPAHAIEDIADDPHIAARGVIVHTDNPEVGPFDYVGYPALIEGEPYTEPRPAPHHGADTVELLRAAGLDADAIDSLLKDKILHQGDAA